MITSILYITIFLIIFFNTEAFVEYIRLIKPLSKLFKVTHFDEAFEKDFDLTYLTYLRQFHDCFFIRLITCPLCISTWISLIVTIFICGNYFVNFPVVLFSSWVLYYSFKKVLK